MPLYRKLPHRGFNQFNFRTEISVVNLVEIEAIDKSFTEINLDVMIKHGLVRPGETAVKILGNGELTRALKVTATRFSDTAKEKIEKAGGQAIIA
jgi:large subunit ribosomal protein L15